MVKPKESKVLGLKWDKQSDMLKISFPNEEVPAMKRGILSKVAKIYDPLGLVSPLTLEGKLLFRDACNEKLPWDVEITKEQLKRWRTWKQSLPVEEEVPRSVAKIQAHPSIQFQQRTTQRTLLAEAVPYLHHCGSWAQNGSVIQQGGQTIRSLNHHPNRQLKTRLVETSFT